jgi:lipopolysaccharide/colanic/teichoic acid biosynthesis glycosyltransferase
VAVSVPQAADGVGKGGWRHAAQYALGDDWSPATGWRLGVKRALDVVLATVFLLAATPVMVGIALAIKLDSPGPVFYRARRVGHRGRSFAMLKFRKMREGAGDSPLTVAGDPRLTRVGAFLARTRLDELPQLWDVLRGRMSIVGPRPEDPRFVDLHHERFDRILAVRPGLTGIAQLAFATEARILDVRDPVADYIDRILPQKLALDTLYADRSGLVLDLLVIWWTVVVVLFRLPVAVDRSTARMRIRRRAYIAAGIEHGMSAQRW